MHVTVLYFAAVRELIGRSEEGLELPADVRTVGQFVAFLERARPAVAGRMGSVRVARNEAFARSEDMIAAEDVLALIPPVAGG
jgi:molybdopterin converting factor subunit 1